MKAGERNNDGNENAMVKTRGAVALANKQTLVCIIAYDCASTWRHCMGTNVGGWISSGGMGGGVPLTAPLLTSAIHFPAFLFLRHLLPFMLWLLPMLCLPTTLTYCLPLPTAAMPY